MPSVRISDYTSPPPATSIDAGQLSDSTRMHTERVLLSSSGNVETTDAGMVTWRLHGPPTKRPCISTSSAAYVRGTGSGLVESGHKGAQRFLPNPPEREI
jgi:hypothetical protein